MARMKAVQLIAHGAPGKLELRDLPDPQPGPGEVVVQVGVHSAPAAVAVPTPETVANPWNAYGMS